MSKTPWERRPPDVYWTQGDTAPAIQEQLFDGTGTAVNLTGAAVRFKATYPAAVDVAQNVDAAATLVTPASGIVRYTPVAADTDTPGEAMLSWKVTFSGGEIEHFMNRTYQKVRVVKRAG